MSRGPRRPSSTSTSAFVKAAQEAGLAARPGKQAIGGVYRNAIEANHAATLTGSVDLDAGFVEAEPMASRWDYGIGVRAGGGELAVWVEPHPAASTKEVGTMLNKLGWLRAKLDQPSFADLKGLTAEASRRGVLPFCWLTSSSIHLRPGSREARLLAQAGLRFPARHLSLP